MFDDHKLNFMPSKLKVPAYFPELPSKIFSVMSLVPEGETWGSRFG